MPVMDTRLMLPQLTPVMDTRLMLPQLTPVMENKSIHKLTLNNAMYALSLTRYGATLILLSTQTILLSTQAILLTLIRPTMLIHGLPKPFLSPTATTFLTDRRLAFTLIHGPELPPSDPNLSSHTRLSDTRFLCTHAVSSFPPPLLSHQWASSKLLKML